MSYRREFAFVGVDTHKQLHVGALCNCWLDVLFELEIPNDPATFPSMLRKLKDACPPGLRLVFGLEGSGGYGYALAAYLKSEGYIVKEVNAVLTDRERQKSPHPDKSDPIDARAIAKVLIDHFEELPEAGTDDEEPFCKTAMAFWEGFPSPGHLKGFGAKRLVRYLRKYGAFNTSEAKARELLQAAGKHRPTTYAQARTTAWFVSITSAAKLARHSGVARCLMPPSLPPSKSSFLVSSMPAIPLGRLCRELTNEKGNAPPAFDRPKARSLVSWIWEYTQALPPKGGCQR